MESSPNRAPRGYLRMLITRRPGAKAATAIEIQEGSPAEALKACDDVADLLDASGRNPEVVTHLRAWKRFGGVLERARAWTPRAAAAAMGALLIWPGPAVNERVSETVRDVVPTIGDVFLADAARIRFVMPPEPLPGQDVPPCGKGYVAIKGGCWAKLEAKAPECPEKSVEHKGGCYLPVKGATPVPMSLERAKP
ncbi:hypothetical protein [Myxococcus landrumensis]|uniref:Uncharacterized protein n=1 Tax=Myxococcus landrumensis TaxID=2813577 RepID=A0ABX7N6F9_9BACT|nr:hypothetical protein [Myxococcus landrumus]QSQ14038.1 hypothetical protein JY572_37950 [Myxococcus landrumus]